MNIRYLQDVLSNMDEIRVIGTSSKVDGVICHVMGLVRRGTDMRLMVLQYDERYPFSIEESEPAESLDSPGMPDTNRALLRSAGKSDPFIPFQSVPKVFIGDKAYDVQGTETRRLSKQDWEHLLLIVRFLNLGWRPNDVDDLSMDRLFLTGLKLEGAYSAIPDFGPDPELQVWMAPRRVTHQVEKPVTLTVGGHYPEKIVFRDLSGGEEHWVQINRVYLLDVWEEMEKILADPVLQEQRTPAEIARARRECEQFLPEICPRGMCFPVVEYECEDDITLQFYAKSYLDAKPACGSRAMGFIVRPQQPAGMLGLKLKAAVIQEPVPADAVAIEAEIFQYIRCQGDGSLTSVRLK